MDFISFSICFIWNIVERVTLCLSPYLFQDRNVIFICLIILTGIVVSSLSKLSRRRSPLENMNVLWHPCFIMLYIWSTGLSHGCSGVLYPGYGLCVRKLSLLWGYQLLITVLRHQRLRYIYSIFILSANSMQVSQTIFERGLLKHKNIS